jgi:hypothetical protein
MIRFLNVVFYRYVKLPEGRFASFSWCNKWENIPWEYFFTINGGWSIVATAAKRSKSTLPNKIVAVYTIARFPQG